MKRRRRARRWSMVIGLLAGALGLFAASLATAADDQDPRASAEWKQHVGAAKEALARDQLADARDHAFAAQHIGDTAEVSALLAVALHGLGLVADDPAQVSHAALLADRCLQQLAEPDPGLDDATRAGIRITCLSIGARANQRLAMNARAHEYAVECLAVKATSVAAARNQRPCRRVFDETEREGFGVHGGSWWKYAVVTAQVGYGFRYFPSSGLYSPGQRLDGMVVSTSVGYPNFNLGPLLLRPELVLRWEHLGDELESDPRSSFTILSLGGRLVLTYPSRFMTLEFGFGVNASQVRVFADDMTTKLYLCSGMRRCEGKDALRYSSGDWSPEMSGVIRWGTPELLLGNLSFLFTAFLEVTQLQDTKVHYIPMAGMTAPMQADDKLTSIGVLFGIAVRLRLGELKPYF